MSKKDILDWSLVLGQSLIFKISLMQVRQLHKNKTHRFFFVFFYLNSNHPTSRLNLNEEPIISDTC